MLPDWPRLKSDLDLAFTLFIRKRVYDTDLPVAQLKKISVFEGNRNTTKGSEDFEDERPMVLLSEIISTDKRPSEITLDDHLLSLNDLAQKMAEHQTKHIFEVISDVCDKTGNIIAGHNLPVEDQFLLVIEKMQIAFDDNGQAQMPTAYVGKEMAEALRNAKESPESKKKFDELMEKKKREWDAEQASRKLVG